jgi:hypothetical protein
MLLSTSWIHDILLTAFAVLVIIILGWSVYALLSSIFSFIFAWGDADKVKWAYNGIRYMIIWLLFTAFLLFVFPLLFKLINIPDYEFFTAGNIFRRVGEILQYIFQLGGLAKDNSWLFDGLDTSWWWGSAWDYRL